MTPEVSDLKWRRRSSLALTLIIRWIRSLYRYYWVCSFEY